MRRPLWLVGGLLGTAVILAALAPRPKGEFERMLDNFADLKVRVQESNGSTRCRLYREHLRFEDLAKRLERLVSGRPGWTAGKVDRWRDSYTAFYVPALARPWWQRWVGYFQTADWRSRIIVTVDRGYVKKDPVTPTPAGHWASMKIVAFSASDGGRYVDPFLTWYPDTSSGW